MGILQKRLFNGDELRLEAYWDQAVGDGYCISLCAQQHSISVASRLFGVPDLAASVKWRFCRRKFLQKNGVGVGGILEVDHVV